MFLKYYISQTIFHTHDWIVNKFAENILILFQRPPSRLVLYQQLGTATIHMVAGFDGTFASSIASCTGESLYFDFMKPKNKKTKLTIVQILPLIWPPGAGRIWLWCSYLAEAISLVLVTVFDVDSIAGFREYHPTLTFPAFSCSKKLETCEPVWNRPEGQIPEALS